MYHLKTVVFVCFLLVSCSDVSQSNTFPLEKPQTINFKSSVDQLISNPIKNAYFGDLHVHTSNSFDAYTFGTLSTPEIAYNYAQGEAILHPSGYFIQLSTPLDFYAVTDHGVFLGILPESANTDSPSRQFLTGNNHTESIVLETGTTGVNSYSITANIIICVNPGARRS